ncbi:hypothetical protein P0D72_41095 [Paraburkholderia sediminicola]
MAYQAAAATQEDSRAGLSAEDSGGKTVTMGYPKLGKQIINVG